MYILSIDQGTTGTTAVLVDAKSFTLIDKVNKEYRQIYPQPGWVEHDLDDIWATVRDTVHSVIENNKIDKNLIKAIGITNQRETTCAFTKDGRHLISFHFFNHPLHLLGRKLLLRINRPNIDFLKAIVAG